MADGALSQVTSLLNTAVTIATEAATGTVSSAQRDSLNSEYKQILDEINQIGTTTTYNGTSVFSAATTSIFLTDANSSSTITNHGGRSFDHRSGADQRRRNEYLARGHRRHRPRKPR